MGILAKRYFKHRHKKTTTWQRFLKWLIPKQKKLKNNAYREGIIDVRAAGIDYDCGVFGESGCMN